MNKYETCSIEQKEVELMKAHVSKIKINKFKFIFSIWDTETGKGQKTIGEGEFKNIEDARIGAEEAFISSLEDKYHNLESDGWIMSTDMACPKCGKSHMICLDSDGNKIFGHIDGTFDNRQGSFSLKLAVA